MGPEALADAGSSWPFSSVPAFAQDRDRVAPRDARRLRLAGRRGGREVASSRRSRASGRSRPPGSSPRSELNPAPPARIPGVRVTLSGPAEVYAAYGPLMEDLKREVFRIALLDAHNGLLHDRVISQGTLSAEPRAPRDVFKPAILESAAVGILLHNHPAATRREPRRTSGDPSAGRVRAPAPTCESSDHLVIGRGRFVSPREGHHLVSLASFSISFPAGSGGARATTSLSARTSDRQDQLLDRVPFTMYVPSHRDGVPRQATVTPLMRSVATSTGKWLSATAVHRAL